MGERKKIIFMGENIDLQNAFKRAFEFAEKVAVLPYKGKLLGRNNIVFTVSDSTFEVWYWGEFRGKKKALNPLVVIGTDTEDVFLHKYPVFVPYKDVHAYFSIPFDLVRLMNKALSLKPIFDQDTRKAMVRDYAQGYEWKLIDHDLKIIKGDKVSSFNNLKTVRDFYESKGDDDTVKIIKTRILGIESNPDWELLLIQIKNELIDRYKTDNVKSYMKNRNIYERGIKGKSRIKQNYKFQQMSSEI